MRPLFIAAAFVLLTLGSTAALADHHNETAKTSAPASKTFVKKRYSIQGEWNITQEDGNTVIHFDEGFKTKGGPDLKLFLSPKPLSELTGDTAQHGAARLSVLKANRGEQSYIIPADISLDDYKSLIIQCEAFSVLWGGFDLAEVEGADAQP